MVAVLIILVIVSQILYPGFLDPSNIRNLLGQNAPVGIVAIGMTFVMIGAGFDLSVGAIAAFAAVVYATWAPSMPLGVAGALALVVGGGLGLTNGVVVTRLKVNPFVATLGSASVFTGAAFLISHSQPISVVKPSFAALGNNVALGIPVSVWILAAIAIAGACLLAWTSFGYSVYAMGGNETAARLAGLRVDALRTSTYVLVGACAGVAGMIMASRVLTAQADMGTTIPLDAITVVIIGGTSLFGGEGAVWRTIVGLLILACVNNLFDSLALDAALQSLVKGLILIAAVAVDARLRLRRA
jgi:ribose transport system permease protein